MPGQILDYESGKKFASLFFKNNDKGQTGALNN